MAAAAKSDAPARDASVTAETARFPQYIRAGFRPMLHTHEDFLASVLAEKPAREFREILDKSLGAFVFSRNAEGELVVALVEERPTKGSPYWSFPKGHPDEGESDVQGAVREVLEEIGIDVSQHLNENLFAETAYTYAGTLHSDSWKQHAAYPNERRRPAAVFYKLVRRYVAIMPEPIQLTPENAQGAALTDIGRTCGRCEWMTIGKTRSVLHAILLAEFEPFMERADVKAALGIK